MLQKSKHFFIFFLVTLTGILYSEDKFFMFIIPSYNNEQWVEKNLESIFIQDYDNYHIIYWDDASTDATGQKVYECCKKHNKSHKVTYIKNKRNHRALYNIYNAVHHYCKDTDIVALLDGDDWLAPRSDVLRILNTTYQDPNTWITYGEFAVLSNPAGTHGVYNYPPSTIENNSFRHNMFYFAHLRTFYAKLFKRVKISEFFYNNDCVHMTWDMLFGIPMLEMAHSHNRYISEIIHIYNDVLPTNDNAKDPSQQMYFDFYIRNKESYKPLTDLFADITPTLGLYYFCNDPSSTEDSLNANLTLLSNTFLLNEIVIGLTHANNNLTTLFNFAYPINIHTLQKCYYHSWISPTTSDEEKQRVYECFSDLTVDYFILTENNHGPLSYDTYIPDLLSLADCIVIGTYTEPLKTGLFKKYPHLAFMPLNCLGQTLDLHKPSTVIIRKEKLLHAIKNSNWCNGSYLSLLTTIDYTYGSEYGIFI